MLCRGIAQYISAAHPRNYLFEGNESEALSQRGTQWVVGEAIKRAGIRKEVHTHTLRHSYDKVESELCTVVIKVSAGLPTFRRLTNSNAYLIQLHKIIMPFLFQYVCYIIDVFTNRLF